jgi:Ca2+-binding EF-hand superfamily protein
MVSSISSSSSLMAALTAKLQQKSTTTAAAEQIVFSKLDLNSDGKVTADELLSAAKSSSTGASSSSESKAASIISSNDKDGDNALSEEELAGFLNQLTSGGLAGSNNAQLASARGDMMTVADANGDGQLSEAEFSAVKPDDVSAEQSASLFKSADSNGDGSLSSDEVSAFEASGPQASAGMKGPMGPPPSSSNDDDEDDSSITSLLSKLIDSLTSSDSTSDTASTSSTSSTDTQDSTTTAQQKLFNFFDQDSDGTVSDKELNNGVVALKTAMANYMLSVQENRAAA